MRIPHAKKQLEVLTSLTKSVKQSVRAGLYQELAVILTGLWRALEVWAHRPLAHQATCMATT